MGQSFPDPPLGLYVHIPWCVRKCPYCDFNSHELKGTLPQAQYIQALLRDLDSERTAAPGRMLESVFIGGGTPSLFEPVMIARLLAEVATRIPLAAHAEITLEANPGTVEAGRFREFAAAGVSRISVGVQSFDDQALQRLGRIHGRREALQAVETALDCGVSQVNLDLMYALPEQTLEGAREDLQIAVGLGPQHISWYQLTLEPNTRFHRQPPPLPDADASWAMHQCGQDILAGAGFERYEISAYARQGAQARHNLNYWRYGDYLGIGAGAHGKISSGRDGAILRTVKLRHPRQYLAALAAGDGCWDLRRTAVTTADRPFEFMLNALRLIAGVEPGLFQQRTGMALQEVQDRLDAAAAAGLLELTRDRIRATEFGLRFLNDLVGMFLERQRV